MMKTASVSIAVAISLLVSLDGTCFANPETGKTELEKARIEWIVGDWTIEKGTGIELSYSWILDKQVIESNALHGINRTKGQIYVDPKSKEVRYHATDNAGAVITGKWICTKQKAILRSSIVGPDGEKFSSMTEHTRVDARTMTVKVYREEQFLGEFRFVRAKQAKTDKKK